MTNAEEVVVLLMCLEVHPWTSVTVQAGISVSRETVKHHRNGFQSMTGRIRLDEPEEVSDMPVNESHSLGLVGWNFIMENLFPVKGLDKVRLDIQSVWISSKMDSEQLTASRISLL